MTYHEQQQSKLPKKGEGDPHTKARLRLGNILIDSGWEIFPNEFMAVEMRMQEREETSAIIHKTMRYKHGWDVYCKKELNNGLVSEMFLEIDGKIHGSKPQQNRDKTAQHYAEFFFPNAKFKRIPISELLGDADDKSIVDFYGLK